MNSLRTKLVEAIFKEVLHSLHVVVRNLFYVFYRLSLLRGEHLRLVAAAKRSSLRFGESRELRKPEARQGDEILYFHLDTVAYGGVFREIVGQRKSFVAIAAVDRRDCGKGSKLHNLAYYEIRVVDDGWKESMCRRFFSSRISSITRKMPLSSTSPNSSLIAVPNIRIVGERLI